MGKQLESSSANALRARLAVTGAVSHTIECPASVKNSTHRHWLTWINRPLMINVMIIDDNEALKLGLSIFVEEEPDMRVVGGFVSAAASLSEVEGLKPDVVLLSVGLPDMTGFEACRKILNLLPSTRIVFIGPGHIKQVMIAGMLTDGSGYLTHGAPRSDVVRTVRANGHGEMFLVPEAAERALWIAQNFRKFVDVGRLSGREKQVLSMVATGLSNADIGTELGISPNTVRNHIKRIFAKLNCPQRRNSATTLT